MTTEQALALAPEIRAAVVAHYIETGDAIDAPGLAKRLGWAESKVRTVLRENFGAIPGTQASQESRTSYSKNYPSMSSGVHRVWCYRPALSTLREIIIAAQSK